MPQHPIPVESPGDSAFAADTNGMTTPVNTGFDVASDADYPVNVGSASGKSIQTAGDIDSAGVVKADTVSPHTTAGDITVKLLDNTKNVIITDKDDVERFHLSADGKLRIGGTSGNIIKQTGDYVEFRSFDDSVRKDVLCNRITSTYCEMSAINPASGNGDIIAKQKNSSYGVQFQRADGTGFFGVNQSAIIAGENIRTRKTVQTTDATVTNINTIAVDVDEAFIVVATVLGVKSDYSEAAAYKICGCFRRATASNVTQVGATQRLMTDIEDDAAWDADFNANTGTQQIEIQVTGKASTTINWEAKIEFHRIDV